uniref:Uncharacterized protein n=1 Tax=viral metagenome TaxID=1070528 RepID=A0A6C0CFK8_9ZZZZ
MEKQLAVKLHRQNSAFGIVDCDHARCQTCFQCTTCFLCGQMLGNISVDSQFIIRGNPASKRFWYHKSCLKEIKCSKIVVSSDRPTEYTLFLTYFGHHESCHNCKKMVPDFVENGIPARIIQEQRCEEVYFHRGCQPMLSCLTCGENESKSGKMQLCGDFMYHEGICTPSPCLFCHEKVLGDSKLLLSNKSNLSFLVHASCLSKQICSRCGHRGETLCLNNLERFLVHFRLDCCSDICPLCKKGIADSNWHEADGKKYHAFCLSIYKCYLCDELIKNHTFSKDEVGFRHSSCDPRPCAKCGAYLGDKLVKTVDGLNYHLHHAPTCFLCFSHEDLQRFNEENYKCSTCNEEPCFVCDCPLGRPNLYFHVPQKVHKNCIFGCEKCYALCYKTERLQKDHVIHPKNLPFVAPSVKANLRTLWGLVRRHRVPKDVAKMILIFGVNCYIGIDHFPFRKDGQIDLRDICSDERCSRDKCSCCKKEMAWSKKDRTRCNSTRCVLIMTGYRTILTKVFQQDDSFRQLKEKEAEIEVSRLVLQKGGELSKKQLLLLSVTINSIDFLRALRAT